METPESGRRAVPVWLPWAVLLLGILVTSLLAQTIADFDHQLKVRLLTAQHQAAADRISDRIDLLIQTGRSLAPLSTAPAHQPKTAAGDALADRAGVVGVERICMIAPANDMRVRDSVGDPAMVLPAGAIATSVDHWTGALHRALATQTVTATDETELKPGLGQPGMVRLFVPGGPDCLLSLVINPARFLAGALAERRTPDLAFAVHDLSQQSKTPLFQLAATGPVDAGAALRSELAVGDRTWMMTTTPTVAFFTDGQDELTQRIWLSGVLISGLMAVLAAVAARQLRRANHRHETDLIAQSKLQQQLDNKLVEKVILKQALDNSELRSRDLVSLTGGFVCELDDRLNIAFISPQVTDLLEQPPADLAERPLEQAIVSRDRDNFRAALEAARRDRQMERIDLHMLTASGQEVAITLRIKAVIEPISGCTGFRLTGQHNPSDR